MVRHIKKQRTKSRFQRKANPFLETLINAAVIVAPLSLLPQLYSVWIEGSNAGVSLATWALTFFITIPLIVYDINHKAAKLVFMHSSIAFISLGIVLGLLVL